MMQRRFWVNEDSELRRSQRFPIVAPLRYRVSHEAVWRSGRTENISSAGVLFRCEQSAERGTRVEINFLVSRSASDDIGLEVACEGEVVRIEHPLETGQLPALAVKLNGYWLSPGRRGHWNNHGSPRERRTDD